MVYCATKRKPIMNTPPESQDSPAMAERTTGREVTPVDWIKMHYGRMIDGEGT